MYGVARGKATGREQIRHFLSNFADPIILYNFLYGVIHSLIISGYGVTIVIFRMIHSSRELIQYNHIDKPGEADL